MWIYDIDKEKNVYIQRGKYARVKGHRTNNWFNRSLRMYLSPNNAAYRAVLWAKNILNINSDLAPDEQEIQDLIYDAMREVAMHCTDHDILVIARQIIQAISLAPTRRKQIALIAVLTSGYFQSEDNFQMPTTAICMKNWKNITKCFFRHDLCYIKYEQNCDGVQIPLFTYDPDDIIWEYDED